MFYILYATGVLYVTCDSCSIYYKCETGVLSYITGDRRSIYSR